MNVYENVFKRIGKKRGCDDMKNGNLDSLGVIHQSVDSKYTKILDEYSKNVPVDVEALAKKLGFSIMKVDFSNLEEQMQILNKFPQKQEISGAIFLKNVKEKEIYISEKEIYTRQRFTIAHEIGHYFMHYDHKNSERQQFISFRSIANHMEREANEFAANLLMPKSEVLELHSSLMIPLLQDFQKKFNVSRQAARVRLDKLGLDYYD